MGKDLFGKALLNYSKGINEPIFFIINYKRKVRPVIRYFRSLYDLTDLEKNLIRRSYGEILDIGCSTGYYIPALEERGNIIGIDKSRHAIQVAINNGLTNCIVGDIFKYKFKAKFDTITLIENNLGLGGSIIKTKELLHILFNLLKADGQILMIQRNIDEDYLVSTIKLEYLSQFEEFKWVHFSRTYLKKLVKEAGFDFSLIKEDLSNSLYLARLTKEKT
jgi:SAM-dependent methyltransferase